MLSHHPTNSGLHTSADFEHLNQIHHILPEVSDAIELNKYAEKWQIEDGRDLVKRIHDLPYASLCAIAEVICRFWTSPELDDLYLADKLIACGAKISKRIDWDLF